MKWNKLESGLPKDDGLYIITHALQEKEQRLTRTEVAMFIKETGNFTSTWMMQTLDGNILITYKDVTHWMPIPKPPIK